MLQRSRMVPRIAPRGVFDLIGISRRNVGMFSNCVQTRNQWSSAESGSRRPAPMKYSQRFYSTRNVVKVLSERGMLNDVFPKEQVPDLIRKLDSESRIVYAGFDPTADSIHLGNLLVIMGLLHFQRGGHEVIALVGGATGRIGDPSGKNVERVQIDEQTLERNISGVMADIERIFRNHRKYFWGKQQSNLVSQSQVGGLDGRDLPPVQYVNNFDWYQNTNIIDFLSNVGRNFRVGKMIARHSVKSRLESEHGISFTEFAYQTFQAYDWLRLHQDRGCLVQLGGSDQMGNIVAGQELISRVTDTQVFGVTLPLVVSETGSKFGKSAGVQVWLAPDKTSPFNLYQFFLRLPDGDLEQLLRFFTFLPAGEISALLEKHTKEPEARLAQEVLARSVTLLVHGKEGLNLAETATRILYKEDMAALSRLSLQETRAIFQQADFVQRLFTPGMTVLDVANKIGCFKTERDAIRIIGAGGFYINQVRRTNTEEVIVHGTHIMANDLMLIRVGKKNYYIVEWT